MTLNVKDTLKWKMGFGWPGPILVFLCTVVSVAVSGVGRIAAIIVASLSLAFIIYQWRKWNTFGWRQAHFRAMLMYATVAANQSVKAKQEGKKFSKFTAGLVLAQQMVGPERKANADAMTIELMLEGGKYFERIVTVYGKRADPLMDIEKINHIATRVREMEFGPQLVIANIIENTFGGEEAARYVFALVDGKAH